MRPRPRRTANPIANPTHHGTGLVMVPILALQEALTIGLYTLASNPHQLDQLLERDDDLQFNSAVEWQKALRKAFRDMVDPSSDNHCAVITGLPTPFGVAKLPVLSLMTQGGGENASAGIHQIDPLGIA